MAVIEVRGWWRRAGTASDDPEYVQISVELTAGGMYVDFAWADDHPEWGMVEKGVVGAGPTWEYWKDSAEAQVWQ